MSFSQRETFLNRGRLTNQKMRTREALLDAALSLVRDGHSLSIVEVAEAAHVSTATAYRYYPNPQSLWSDLAIRQSYNYPELLEDLPDAIEDRIDQVVRTVAGFQFADEVMWRGVLRATLERWFSQLHADDDDRVPARGTTRLEMARTALEPLHDRLGSDQLERLTNAVAMVFGVEALVAARDTCGLEPHAATELMSWAARSLVRAALAESEHQEK
jgi:AcrR family transcriptional regulator